MVVRAIHEKAIYRFPLSFRRSPFEILLEAFLHLSNPLHCSPDKMEASEKAAGIQHFQLDSGDSFEDNHYAKKSNAADIRDMARMGKPQEMRVSRMACHYVSYHEASY